MEIERHSRIIDARQEHQVISFMKHLGDLISCYRDMGDIFVSIKSEDRNYIILEESEISNHILGVLHHCLFVSPPLFKIVCTTKVIYNEMLSNPT